MSDHPPLTFAAIGLALSVLLVRDTACHARAEAASMTRRGESRRVSVGEHLARGTWRDPALATASQAGLVNNLNDGLAWGLFPLFFAAAGLSLGQIGLLAFVYPAVWGLVQLWTGALSDRWGRKWLIVAGMLVATILGVCLIPMLFVAVEKVTGGSKHAAPEASPAAPPALAGHGGGH